MSSSQFFQTFIFIPLAYRGEWVYFSLDYREVTVEQAFGPRTGNIGSADPENAGAGAAERMGDQPAANIVVWRSAPGQRGLALPRPAQARAGGLDPRRVEASRAADMRRR